MLFSCLMTEVQLHLELDIQLKDKGEGIKKLTPKQMIQRLSIGLAQIKAGSRFENLLNETWQFILLFILFIYIICHILFISPKTNY